MKIPPARTRCKVQSPLHGGTPAPAFDPALSLAHDALLHAQETIAEYRRLAERQAATIDRYHSLSESQIATINRQTACIERLNVALEQSTWMCRELLHVQPMPTQDGEVLN